MTDYVFPPEQPVSLPVRGTATRFPVRRIYCVGRNYAEHIKEMGGDPQRERPFFFQKPTDSIVEDGGQVPYPAFTEDFQHEVELLLAIGEGGTNIAVENALKHVYAVGVAIDLTRRDVQLEARKTGRPWEVGKSFDHSAPCSELVSVEPEAVPAAGPIELKVNGEIRQYGDLGQMVWSSAEIIHHLSGQYELRQGDLIMTGTPAGVGRIERGDRVEAVIHGIASLAISIV